MSDERNISHPEAAFTFAQLAAAVEVLRTYGAEAVTAHQYGMDVPDELEFVRSIVRALGGNA